MHTEAAHLVTAPQRSARFPIDALNARVSFIFVALEAASIRMHLKDVCTIVFFTPLQYYEYIYHSQGASILAKKPFGQHKSFKKIQTDDHQQYTIYSMGNTPVLVPPFTLDCSMKFIAPPTPYVINSRPPDVQ